MLCYYIQSTPSIIKAMKQTLTVTLKLQIKSHNCNKKKKQLEKMRERQQLDYPFVEGAEATQ